MMHLLHGFSRRTVLVGLCFFVTLSLSGCGRDGLGFVAGRVSVDGQPAPEGISIEFAPAVPGEFGSSFATVASDGTYTAVNPAAGKNGVVVGICVARLVENELTTLLPQRDGQMPTPKYDPKQFKEIARFEVKAGSNSVDLELTPAEK